MRFQDVVRGDAWTTRYFWTVGARDNETNTTVIATPSTVDVSKTFSNEMPASPLIREVNRGIAATEPYADGTSVLFSNGLRFDPVREGEPDLPAALTAEPLREGEPGAFLVQLDGPPRRRRPRRALVRGRRRHLVHPELHLSGPGAGRVQDRSGSSSVCEMGWGVPSAYKLSGPRK